jgi:hypothetical protein
MDKYYALKGLHHTRRGRLMLPRRSKLIGLALPRVREYATLGFVISPNSGRKCKDTRRLCLTHTLEPTNSREEFATSKLTGRSNEFVGSLEASPIQDRADFFLENGHSVKSCLPS